jgi:phage terminase large subunit-like protein
VKLAISRVERYKREYKFYQSRADKRISFIENECSNTKTETGRLKLALVQKVWLEVAFGFYEKVEVKKINVDTMEEYTEIEERRLINEIPLVVSRGSGKTTLGSAIGTTMQIIDGEHGADVQLLAYNREQAGFLFEASRAMSLSEDSLLFYLRNYDILTSTKQGMLFRPTNSLMRIKTSDYESLDGTNAHCNIFDEVHTYDDDFIKVVNDGSRKKRKNWQTWYLTTNGTKRDGIFDKYFDFWIDVLEEKIKNDHIIPWIYCLDSIDEIHDSKMWQKAIPMIGILTDYETIFQEIEMSKDDPVQQAELMAKTFNIPINNYQMYFTNEECLGNKESFDISLFTGTDEHMARSILGIDLSDVNDICSISFMVPIEDSFMFLNKKYLPRKTVDGLPREKREKYLEWESKGFLTIHDLDYNDQEYIFDDLYDFMTRNKILPVLVGYDKWNAREIIRRFEEYYGSEKAQVVPQTVKTLSRPMKIYKEKIKNRKIIFNDPVATWNHLNVMAKLDANGNVFPNKARSADKIDVFASQLDAFATYENNKDLISYYF